MDFLKSSLGRLLVVLLCILLLTASVSTVFGIVSSNANNHTLNKRTITVSADDKVLAKPDIARFTVSVVSKGKTVTAVTTDGNQKMTNIINALKEMQIGEKDIQTTSYYLNPEPDYSVLPTPPQTPKIIGYTLNQSVEVKVRKLDQVGDVLQKVTSLGANEVGNISLTIDDPDQLKSQAREKAFAKAKAKAATLAQQAGVTLGAIDSFSDDSANPYPYESYSSKSMMPMSAAGDVAAPAPSIQTGSEEVHASVSITYEIY